MKKMETEDILNKIEELKNYFEIRDFINSLDLTSEQYEVLFKNEKHLVKWEIAHHPDLPKKLVYKFAEDEDYHIREGIVWHPDLPEDLKYKLAEAEEDHVKWLIAQHPALPEDLIYKLGTDEEKYVRWGIARYSDLPKDLIIKLSCDIDRLASSRGFEKLRKLKNLKSEDLEKAYDLIRTSKHIDKEEFEKTFNYIISNFPELYEASKLFKSIILKGKKDLK
jgi:hypothetical protein